MRKRLDGFAGLDGHYPLSVDGTGHFSSKSVHCDSCCVRNHKDGTKTYYHQMLGLEHNYGHGHPDRKRPWQTDGGDQRELLLELENS